MSLRCGIVGTGGVAHLHAQAVASHPAARLVAVTDIDPQSAREFSARWHDAPVYESVGSLLRGARVDVVLICTPPGVHRDQAVEALTAGVHVIVEKPPASSLDELQQMRAAAAIAGKTLAVVFQQRTGSAANHVRGLIRSGALGRPLIATCHTLWYRPQSYYDVPWRGRWDTEGGGTTLGHGIHQIDLLAHLLGDWVSVQGRLWLLDRETESEDASTALVVFGNGAVASVVSSAVSPRETSSLRIDTQKATVSVDFIAGHGRDEWSITPAPGVGDCESSTWAFPDEDVRSGHEPLLHEVFDALLSGRPLPATATDPERSFSLVAGLYASSAANGAFVTPGDVASHPTHRHTFAGPIADMRRVVG